MITWQAKDSYSRLRNVLYVLAIILAIVYGQYNELSMALDVSLFRLPGSSFYFLDILLSMCLGVWVFVKHKSKWDRSPERWLLLFLGWTLIVGTFRSVVLDVPSQTVFRELRTLGYFGFILLLPEAIDSKGRAVVLSRLLLISSLFITVMAVAVLLFRFDIAPQVNLLSYTESGTPRIFGVYGAERATYAALFAFGLLLAYRGRLYWIALAFNAVTLILALTRGTILAFFVGVAITVGLFRGGKRTIRVVALVVILTGIVLGGVFVSDTITGANQLQGLKTRVGGFEDLIQGSGTVGSRFVESSVVVNFLYDNPDALFLGQGLGGLFADPLNLLTDEIHNLGDRRYSYVHNGYLWTILRSGLIGATFLYLFWISLAFKSLALARRISDRELKGILVGVFAVSVGTLVLSLSGQPLGEGARMSVLTVYAALGLASIRLAEQTILNESKQTDMLVQMTSSSSIPVASKNLS